MTWAGINAKVSLCFLGLIFSGVQGLINFSMSSVINGFRHSGCEVEEKVGVCMFSFECHMMGGEALGLCRDRMFFRACCGSPALINPSSAFVTHPGGQFFPVQRAEPEYECGKSSISGEFESRIVNGVEAKVGEFPWQASLRVVTAFPVTLGWCGAVVLSQLWVITAAHCVKNMKTRNIIIRYGTHSIFAGLDPSPTEERQAVRVIIHPEFTRLSKGHDIALVKVHEPIEFNEKISPICLPGNGIGDLIGEKAIVSGWGKGQAEDDFPTFLQKAVVPILDNKECQKMYHIERKFLKMKKNFICAGYREGGTDSCQGDSGGPLQVLGQEGRWFLAGVTSSGYMCAKPNLPGLYTRISLYVPWILDHTAARIP